MEIALIPPVSMLEKTLGRKFQMLIPQPLTDPTDWNFYHTIGHRDGYYVMMDNGMFEKTEVEPKVLVSMAHRFNVQEIVLPDVWSEPSATTDVIAEFFLKAGEPPEDFHPVLAAVAHGGTLRDAQAFVDYISRLPAIDAIHISRSGTYATKNYNFRIDLADWIDEEYPGRFDIHFLGFDDTWHGEVSVAADIGCVRSLDTVAPFTAAWANMKLSPAGPLRILRPDDYFFRRAEEFPDALVDRNIAYLDFLAKGEMPSEISRNLGQ